MAGQTAEVKPLSRCVIQIYKKINKTKKKRFMKELGKLRTQQGWCNTHCLYTSSYTKQSGESSYSHIQPYRPFPTNPPPPKRRVQQRKYIFFFFFWRKREKRKERNRIMRDGGIRGSGAESEKIGHWFCEVRRDRSFVKPVLWGAATNNRPFFFWKWLIDTAISDIEIDL